LEPIKDLEELKKLAGSADAIDRCKDYLTMTSTHFSIRITVTCGMARTRTVAAVIQEGEKVRKVAVLSD
jgi:hypothetical protein